MGNHHDYWVVFFPKFLGDSKNAPEVVSNPYLPAKDTGKRQNQPEMGQLQGYPSFPPEIHPRGGLFLLPDPGILMVSISKPDCPRRRNNGGVEFP